MADDKYELLWSTYQGYVGKDGVPPRSPCRHATGFLNWFDKLYENLRRSTSLAHGAKAELVDQYFTRFQAAGPEHQMVSPAPDGHICIFEVFQASYFVLVEMQLDRLPDKYTSEAIAKQMGTREPVSAIILASLGQR